MIKRMPSEIQLPNYKLSVEFVDASELIDENSSSSFGELSLKDYKIKLSSTGSVFDRYLYSTFIMYSIGSAYDVNLSKHKAYSVGQFVYHILQFNSPRKIFKHFTRKSKFDDFIVSVPSFELEVQPHMEERVPLGTISIINRKIDIFYECIPELKNVILFHELFEWANTLYHLRLKHIEIQSLAEGLVYVLTNNEFTS